MQLKESGGRPSGEGREFQLVSGETLGGISIKVTMAGVGSGYERTFGFGCESAWWA
jgi:hypothetical protein